MMIAWRPVRPTHKLSAHAVPCTAIRHTHRHPELSDSADDDDRMTMCLYVCRNTIASLTALLSLLRTQSSCYHLVTSTYMFGDCVIEKCFLRNPHFIFGSSLQNRRLGTPISIWATNRWKLDRKSAFHLLFILPKSSFGTNLWVFYGHNRHAIIILSCLPTHRHDIIILRLEVVSWTCTSSCDHQWFIISWFLVMLSSSWLEVYPSQTKILERMTKEEIRIFEALFNGS